MVRTLDPHDFRAHRKILDPDDFALSDDKPDPAPTDLISQNVWDGIMTLPDDVAIRTTNHQGDRVALLHELWSGWVEVFPSKGILSEAALDVSDDFAASLFNLVHGYYKQAIAALRSALETMVIACNCELSGDSSGWSDWQRGEEPKFAEVCKRLASLPVVELHEAQVRKVVSLGMLINMSEPKTPNWGRNLYGRLSSFSHARGDTTNGELWESNGPVYSAIGMRLSYRSYLETYVLALLLARMARSDFKLPKEAEILFREESFPHYLDEPFLGVCREYFRMIYGDKR